MTKPEKRLHIGAKKTHFPLPCLYTLFTSLEEKLFEITKQLLLDDVVRKSHYVSDWLGIKNKQRGQFDTSHPWGLRVKTCKAFDIALYIPASDLFYKIVETSRLVRGAMGIKESSAFNPSYL